ncbi:hypothetical protein F5Y18DRAFT_415161 [Xylariaceae sp. FL1019]|nr:hypothetical protein F5Y18DRAFT_415161 [Xylariaceae sp. FL1019]
MIEVVPADRTSLLQSKRAECSAIARSRKRKLCILYEVSASPGDVPKRSFTNQVAFTPPLAEAQFLDGCDIFQGRRLNAINVPTPATPQPGYVVSTTPTVTKLAPQTAVIPLTTQARRNSVSKIADASAKVLSTVPSNVSNVPSQQVAEVKAPIVPETRIPVATVKPPESTATKFNVPLATAKADGNTGQLHAETVALQVKPNGEGVQHGQRKISPARNSDSLPAPATPQRVEKHQQKPSLILEASASKTAQDVAPSPAAVSLKNPLESLADKQPTPKPSHPESSPLPATSSSAASTTPALPVPTARDTSMTDRTDDNKLQPLTNGHKGSTSESEVLDISGISRQNKSQITPLTSSLVTVSDEQPTSQSVGAQLEAQLIQDSTAAAASPTDDKASTVDTAQKDGIVKVAHPLPSSSTSSAEPQPDNGRPELPSDNDVSERPTVLESPAVQNAIQPEWPHVASIPAAIESARSVRLESSPEQSNDSQLLTKVSVSPDAVQEDAKKPSTSQNTVSPEREHMSLTSITDVALQKPVSEILGERLDSPTELLPPNESQLSQSMPITPVSQSSKARPQSLISKNRTKNRSKLSSVVFGKQGHRAPKTSQSLIPQPPKSDQVVNDDYFNALFVSGFANTSKWMKPLDQLLYQAHKTVSTSDSYTQIQDNQACKVLRRVYSLQHHDKWSLRQHKRCPEPTRQACQWDTLLQEMKWMRTDFREERKWKMAAARSLAEACAEWVGASKEERKQLQIDAFIPPIQMNDAEEAMMIHAEPAQAPESHPTPDLIPSGNSDSPLDIDEELDDEILNTVAPSAIFALPDDEFVFSLQPSAATYRLLEELPMYGAPLGTLKPGLGASAFDPDDSWRRPALPISRFAEGRMELSASEPPIKRGRFQHIQEDEEDEEVIFGQDDSEVAKLSPQSPDVALFCSENKSIRDRLHAGHQFRPPSEHNMPFQAFYESRSPSQWTQSEDDELKGQVREYSYNWSLISNLLSAKSTFGSAAERRSPWECFERWVMLEGLPHDMQKTQYFKLWQTRIEAAQQHLRQQNHAAMQQAQLQAQQQAQNQAQQQSGQPPSQGSANAPSTPLPRRRYTLPVKVERRRNGKHLTMVDAMRKVAKKRETTLQKAQQQAQVAAARKPSEVPQPKGPIKTPREYSIMRYERDQALAEKVAEKMAHQQRQHEAQRRVRAAINNAPHNANVQSQAAAIQRVQQQTQIAQLAAAAQNGNQLQQGNPQMAASHPHAAAMARPNAPNQITVNGQNRARMAMPMPSTPNGTEHSNHMNGTLVPPVQMNGSPQIQMPVVSGQAQMSMPTSAANMHLLLQAQRASEQQRQIQMRQRQQQQHQPQPTQAQLQQHQQLAQQQMQQHMHQQQQQQHQQQHQHQHQQHQQQLNTNHQVNNALQNSPPSMRAQAINGMNQRNFLANAQAQVAMAAYNGVNGSGLSTPPAAGFNLTPGQSGSPRPNGMMSSHPQTYVSQLQAIENNIRQSYPDQPQDKIREMAKHLLQQRHDAMQRSAMNAAAGSPGHAQTTNSPHHYAQMLRAQQQQQAAAAAVTAKTQGQAATVQQAQAQGPSQGQVQVQTPIHAPVPQARASQPNPQHQRNSSGSATPTPAATVSK